MRELNNSTSQEDSESKKAIGKASFAITARIAMQLGRESISNSITAIIELVKNAYDADTENVQIIFSNLRGSNPTLIIDDDGTGMNLEQLKNSWLVIGTDTKLISAKSKRKNRTLTGEKGLGRLGLDRLCESTQVQTFVEDEVHGIELDIDWKKYEGTNEKLEAIEHNMYRISKNVIDPITGKEAIKNKGTRLILKGLKDSWIDGDLEKLWLELALLISPFAGVNDFSILFHSGVSTSLDRKIVSDNLLDAAEWMVTSTIDISEKEALINFTMSSSTDKALFDHATTWAKAFPEERHRIPECGPVKFVFYYLPRKDFPDLSLKKGQIERFLNNNQGIRIYRDAFRVAPYGRPSGDGDWLNLSFRRIRSPAPITGPVGSWKLGYNQVVGAVFIGRETNLALFDQTNREGIVEGPAFYDLKNFALYAVGRFEKELQRYEQAQGPKKESGFGKARDAVEESSKTSTTRVDQFRSKINSAIEVLTESSKIIDTSEQGSNNGATKETAVSEISQVVSEITKFITDQQNLQEQLIEAADRHEEERQEEFQNQKDTLGNLASLGILATAFGHETEGASNLVLTNSKELKLRTSQFQIGQLFSLTSEDQKAIIDSVEALEYAAKKINTFANFTLRNVSRDRRQRTKIFLDELVKKVFISFSDILERERKIQVDFDFPPQIPSINAFYIDWESILVNFITNAVWALNTNQGENRKIRVRLREESDLLHLSFADSGYGIAEGTAEDIFVPTFSTKKSRSGDVIGTGMGLAIVQNFVMSYNGTIYVESPCDLGGAEFHIKVPASKK